ncbi:MAG: potassium-transporting ATPase subunit KdpC [Pirellulales bacterium]
MFQQLRIATMMLAVLSILTGGVYPLLVTIVAQTFLPHQANGSMLKDGDQLTGSELIGQSFAGPQYFWGRLSATANSPYNAGASGGSNWGPLHAERERAASERLRALQAAGGEAGPAPGDLTTASGSGLDPHISVAAAEYQVARVARARGLREDVVRELLEADTAPRQWGVLGEPRVNVLRLNLALDRLARGK